MSTKDIKETRQRILDEMNARRIDGKTYIDSEWLLNEYETALTQHHQAEVRRAVDLALKNASSEDLLEEITGRGYTKIEVVAKDNKAGSPGSSKPASGIRFQTTPTKTDKQ